MAAPESKCPQNMTGTWVMNRQLSDDLDPTFATQGIPWVVRKMLAFAGVRIELTQQAPGSPGSAASESAESIHFKQVVTPGGFLTEEDYILDGQVREGTVPIFGTISVQAQYLALQELEDAALRKQLEEGETGECAIEERTTSPAGGWSSRGIWGFEKIAGERRFVRTNWTKKDGGEEELVARIVYDYRED